MKTIMMILAFSGPTQTFHGVITDTMCGAKHTMVRGVADEQCVKLCVKGSGEYALFDGTTVWKLSDQKKAAGFAAKNVIVTGVADTTKKTVRVDSIQGGR